VGDFAFVVGRGGLQIIQFYGAGIEETPNAEVRTTNAATVIRGVLFLPEASSLLDIAGRKVLNLHVGRNDVRALTLGVYFLREELRATSPKPQAVRKVVIAR
jgi:hypothetical protein